MEAVKRVLKFGLGGAFGAAIGAGVASLLAPQRGEEFQATSRAFLDEVKSEGERAQQATEAEMSRRFRVQVSDDKALTGDPEHREPRLI